MPTKYRLVLTPGDVKSGVGKMSHEWQKEDKTRIPTTPESPFELNGGDIIDFIFGPAPGTSTPRWNTVEIILEVAPIIGFLKSNPSEMFNTAVHNGTPEPGNTNTHVKWTTTLDQPSTGSHGGRYAFKVTVLFTENGASPTVTTIYRDPDPRMIVGGSG